MSILLSEDKKELIVTCDCHCDNACHITVDSELLEFGILSYMAFMKGDTSIGYAGGLGRKFKHIWRILSNGDFCYSDICMTRNDWNTFRDWVNARDEEIQKLPLDREKD